MLQDGELRDCLRIEAESHVYSSPLNLKEVNGSTPSFDYQGLK